MLQEEKECEKKVFKKCHSRDTHCRALLLTPVNILTSVRANQDHQRSRHERELKQNYSKLRSRSHEQMFVTIFL